MNRQFMLLSFTTGIWFLSYFFMYNTADISQAYLFGKIGYFGIIFIPTFLYGFIAEFINSEGYKKYILLTWVAGLYFAALNLFGLFITDVSRYYWGFYPRGGFNLLAFIVYFCVIFAVGLQALLFDRNKALPVKYKSKYLFIAFALAVLGCVDYFGNYGFSIYPFGYLCSTACIAVVFIAITKARLMDISVIISKSIAYLLTIIILGSLYLMFVIPYKILISQDIGASFISLTVVIGIFVGFFFERLRMLIQTSSDKFFLKGRYDFTDTLAQVTEALASVVSLKDLFDLIEKIRIDHIEAAMMKLNILGEEQDDELIRYFKQYKKVVRLSEIPKDISSSIIPDGTEIVAPCSIKGRLIAILFVGHKLSEDPYREEEVDVFSVMAPQLATVIERIQPYEKVKEDFVVVQQAAERAQQMATLGEIALQAGHEIKNPVAAINIHTELLASHIGEKEYVDKYIDLVKRNSKKIEDIVDKMKQFGTAKTEEKKETDLNSLIKDRALFLMEGHIKKNDIKVELDLKDIPKIQADEASLEKAFVNIMLNAVEAMDAGGVMSIKTASIGNNVEVRISDTGHGISKENMGKIFLPMFTTRHEGTGLGLSITYRTIVTDHGGNIDVKSEEGRGSEFIVSIPVYQVPSAA